MLLRYNKNIIAVWPSYKCQAFEIFRIYLNEEERIWYFRNGKQPEQIYRRFQRSVCGNLIVIILMIIIITGIKCFLWIKKYPSSYAK